MRSWLAQQYPSCAQSSTVSAAMILLRTWQLGAAIETGVDKLAIGAVDSPLGRQPAAVVERV